MFLIACTMIFIANLSIHDKFILDGCSALAQFIWYSYCYTKSPIQLLSNSHIASDDTSPCNIFRDKSTFFTFKVRTTEWDWVGNSFHRDYLWMKDLFIRSYWSVLQMILSFQNNMIFAISPKLSNYLRKVSLNCSDIRFNKYSQRSWM